MKELQLDGVHELNATQLSEVNGGYLWPAFGLLFDLLIGDWESTKQAAVDAWNGTYNPPE